MINVGDDGETADFLGVLTEVHMVGKGQKGKAGIILQYKKGFEPEFVHTLLIIA